MKIQFSVTDPESTNDPATWNAASYTPDMCAEIDGPLDIAAGECRETAIRMICLLEVIETFMCGGEEIPTRWIQVSIALGLRNFRGRSITEIAKSRGCTKQNLSRGICHFLRMAQLSPAWGLKSPESRVKYQKTNGHRARRPAEVVVSAQSDA